MEDYHSLYCTPEGRLLVVDLNERSYCQVGHKFRGPFGPAGNGESRLRKCPSTSNPEFEYFSGTVVPRVVISNSSHGPLVPWPDFAPTRIPRQTNTTATVASCSHPRKCGQGRRPRRSNGITPTTSSSTPRRGEVLYGQYNNIMLGLCEREEFLLHRGPGTEGVRFYRLSVQKAQPLRLGSFHSLPASFSLLSFLSLITPRLLRYGRPRERSRQLNEGL